MPGDTFLFKYGEQWEVRSNYINASGLLNQPIVYGAYGDPNDGLPIITNVTKISAAENAANWSEVEPNIWYLPLVEPPGRFFLDGVEQLRANADSTLGLIDNEGALGKWYYDTTGTDGLYLSESQNPATLYSEFRGCEVFYSTLIEYADYIILDHLDLRGGSGAAIAIIGGNHIEVTNCRIGHSGGTGLFATDILISGTYEPSTDLTISNNIFDSNFQFFYGLGSERGCGDGIRFVSGVQNCIASNNEFYNWAHNAIELQDTAARGVGVSNNKFHDNYITAPAIPYAHPFGVDGFQGQCQNNEFYRNLIKDCRTTSQVNGNNNWVHHNIIVGMKNSPSKPNEPTAFAFTLGTYGTGFVSENNRFDHNLIIDTEEAAFRVRDFGFANQVKNNLIRNNIIYDCGKQPLVSSIFGYQVGTGILLRDDSNGGVGPNTFQNNLFFSDSVGAEMVYVRDSTTYYSATEFNAINGQNGNTISGNIEGDPLFTDYDNEDYAPLSSSPAIDAGVSTGINLDYDQQARLVGSAVDIGPFENPGVILPVLYAKFDAILKIDQSVQLLWQTLSEWNAHSFIIQRQVEKGQWKNLGQVKAANNGNTYSNYNFIDTQALPGDNYYRLKQVDFDGTVHFSSIVSITLPYTREIIDLVYPNPAVDFIFLPTQISSELIIRDALGRIVAKYAIGAGSRVDISALESGTYFLEWKAEGKGKSSIIYKK